MARRARKPKDQGPAVPRWVAEFDPERWPGGFSEWSSAVHHWTKVNLYNRGEFGAWLDLGRNIYATQARLRAQGYWNDDAA